VQTGNGNSFWRHFAEKLNFCFFFLGFSRFSTLAARIYIRDEPTLLHTFLSWTRVSPLTTDLNVWCVLCFIDDNVCAACSHPDTFESVIDNFCMSEFGNIVNIG